MQRLHHALPCQDITIVSEIFPVTDHTLSDLYIHYLICPLLAQPENWCEIYNGVIGPKELQYQ